MLAQPPNAIPAGASPAGVAAAPAWVRRLLSLELIWVVAGVALIDVPGLAAPLRWLGWVLLLAAWPLRLRYRQFARTPMDWPIVIFCLGLLVGLYASVDHRLSFEALPTFGAAILLFYAIVNQTSPRYIIGITFLGTAVAFVAIPWVFGQGQIPPSKLLAYNQWALDLAGRFFPRVGSYSPHMNGLAGGLGAVIPLLGGVALCTRSWRLRIAASFAVFMLVNTVLMSGSRGGWVGLTAAIFVLAALRFRWLFLVVPMTGLVAYALMSTGAIEVNDLLAVTSGQTLILRTEVWRTSLDMLADVPFTGVGLASFPLVYSYYTPPSLPVGVTNPHDAMLQVYADTGILGAVSVLWGIGVLVGMAWRLARHPQRGAMYGLAIGLAASLAGQMAYGVFESTVTVVYLDRAGAYHCLASPVVPLLVGLFFATTKLLWSRPAPAEAAVPAAPPVDPPPPEEPEPYGAAPA